MFVNSSEFYDPMGIKLVSRIGLVNETLFSIHSDEKCRNTRTDVSFMILFSESTLSLQLVNHMTTSVPIQKDSQKVDLYTLMFLAERVLNH